MPTASTGVFEGYLELVKKPLEFDDPRSFSLIEKLLGEIKEPNGSPLSALIKTLSGVSISRDEAQQHWKKILAHKRRLENALRRPVGIKTAVVDYYDLSGVAVDSSSHEKPAQPHPAASSAIPRPETPVASPGYHQDRLKEEIQRARRYKHALSAIMVQVDRSTLSAMLPGHDLGDKVMSLCDSMITKAIRNVDIRARHSENLFFIILPNTNKREAQELAGRLLKNISTRMQRLPGMTATPPLKAAVGQCTGKNDTAGDFIRRLEHLLASSKNEKPDAVLLLD